MKLLSATFVTSAAGAEGIPNDGLPRVALAGRSNVGKSSLLNALCRLKIARTSAAPGKTRLLNFYRTSVEGGPGGPGTWNMYLVDLPGYGYARGGADSAAELAAVADAYFRSANSNSRARNVSSAAAKAREGSDAELNFRATPSKLALLLIDSRHPGLPADRSAGMWLGQLGVEFLVVATKIDKLSRNERAKNLKALENMFGTAALPVSASSGEGMDELWRTIARLVRTVEAE